MDREEQYGGWQEVATHLTALFHRPISRQQVYMWWSRREHNGFPEAHHSGQESKQVTVGSYEHTYQKHLFDLDEVTQWYATYKPNTGVRDDTQPHYASRKKESHASEEGTDSSSPEAT